MARPGRCCRALRLWSLWWVVVCCVQMASPAAPSEIRVYAPHTDPCRVRHASSHSARDEELLSCSSESLRASRTLPTPHHASSVFLRRFPSSQPSGEQEHARTLAAAAPEAPILAPRPPPPPPTPYTEILAPERTHRKNPLQGFTYWSLGWNIISLNYWAVSFWMEYC